MNVLIVDDSVIFRSKIREALEGLSGTNLLEVASNGKIALHKMGKKDFDIIILDLEMPELNGVETIKEIKARKYPGKTLIFSSVSVANGMETLKALELGADDFVPKPQGCSGAGFVDPAEAIKNVLLPKVLQFLDPLHPFSVGKELEEAESLTLDKPPPATPPQEILPSSNYIKKEISTFNPKIIVIGSSTGGPHALQVIFKNLKGPLRCPILIAQHMPPLFTQALAESLRKINGVECTEGIDGEEIKNKVYVAPGNFHMVLKKIGDTLKISLNQDPLINMVRPSVDPLFESAAKIFGKSALGVILTGMGQDGKNGCVSIKNNNGGVIIQSQDTCVVYGMPRAVFESGAFDSVEDLENIGKGLSRMMEGGYF